MVNVVRRKLHRAVWLLSYWAFDKHARACSVGALLLAVVMACAVTVQMLLQGPPADGEPQRAYWQIVWYIVVLLVSAYISYSLRPKPQDPDPQLGKAPETRDGKAVREIFGTVWTDDPTIVGWRNLDPEPIRKKGGKK